VSSQRPGVARDCRVRLNERVAESGSGVVAERLDLTCVDLLIVCNLCCEMKKGGMSDSDHMEGVTSRVTHRVTPSHGRCQAVREQGEKIKHVAAPKLSQGDGR
jgi:hypothetical protein